MNFLFPAFLWGLLAVLIPLAIHLFNFRRTKRVLFTNVSFLKEIETEKSSFRKLKQWLILFSRMMALACLAIAFAQPYLREEGEVGGYQHAMSFYLDNSLSMQNEANSKRFIDRARSTLDELMTFYPNLTSLQLVTNDFSPGERNMLTAGQFQDRLASTDLTPKFRTLEEVYRRQVRLLESVNTNQPKELFWISDFQKSTSGNLSSLAIDSAFQVNLIPIQTGLVRNVYIDSVWLHTPFLREQQKNVLYVKLTNSGNEPIENLPVRLFLNETQVSATSIDIPAAGSEQTSFDFNINEQGFIKGMVSFDDFPVTFDNRYFFVLNPSPLISILHLHDGGLLPGDPVARVYRNDSLFRIENVSVTNIDVGRIATANLVILNEIHRLAPTLIQNLQDFVRQGGSLLVIPPTTPDLEVYRSLLEPLGVLGLRGWTGEAIPLQAPDVSIPFFRDVFEATLHTEGQINMPSATKVWQWSQAGSTLLNLRNNQPYLSQLRVTDGSLYLLGSPLDAVAGNFSQHALFVPVMYKIAALSVRPTALSHSYEDPIVELTVDDPRPNSVFKLRNGEVEIIPIQRLTGKHLVVELSQSHERVGESLEPGYFELLNNDKLIDLLAFNSGKKESQMTFYTPVELREIFASRENVKIFDEIEGSELRSKLEQQASGTRLWKYFLYAALFFLLIEILLIRLMKD